VISGRIDIIVSDSVRIYSNNRFLVTDVMSHYAFCLIIRPHNKHSVHTMRPIATDGVALSVRLSVGHVRELCMQKWLNRWTRMEMPFAGLTGWLRGTAVERRGPANFPCPTLDL